MNKNTDLETNFEIEVRQRISDNSNNTELKNLSHDFMRSSLESKYSYNFSWLGRPIIQYPQDLIALQELIWRCQPDLIIETGIAHGGSLIFYASLLELLGKGKVIGIDIDIREHNRKAIEAHPLFKRIELIESSSTDSATLSTVSKQAQQANSVLVVLDSNHTHDHVLQELIHYAPMVTKNSYIVALDTIVELHPEATSANRPWNKGNNPYTAAQEFLEINHDFEIDFEIENKIMITAAPSGYLKRVR